MSDTKTVTVSSETYQQMQLLRSRLVATDPRKLPPALAAFIARGASLSSIVSVGVELLDRELTLLEQPAEPVRADETSAKPARAKRERKEPDTSHLLPGEKVDFKWPPKKSK